MDLYDAISNHDEKLAIEIIDKGIDVNLVIEGQRPILIHALCKECSNVANKLIDNKADINVKERHGTQAIQYAASFRLEQIIIRMLDMGVDLLLKNQWGESSMSSISECNVPAAYNHLKFMHLNCLLDAVNDESTKLSKCFANHGDLNVLDIINDFSQIFYN